ncbi:HYC_CC_PP family protein [Pedobacter immunditicola]|uniref:HYC_CC_PP family protein n=1 Tax=Pedobacter immunditicola TaxID=3133440 RepID=UPI0030AB70F4
MKRILLIFLAVFYFGISQGAIVYFHYCMGELVQMGMTESKPSLCEFCGMDSKESREKTCCKQESKLLQVDNVQKMAASHFQFEQAPVIVLKNIIWEARNIAVPIELGKASLSNAPPQEQDVPVFIRNCTYRI